MIKMPGKSYSGPLPPLTNEQFALRAELRSHIDALASQISDKNTLNYINLSAAADYIESTLTDAGCSPRRQNYSAEGKTCSNLEVQLTGQKFPDQIIVIGAHYDSVYGSPGANDNCSAVAANLALARRFKDTKTDRTLRFVFFANEEMPFFQSDLMGSRVYAKSCRDKNENIVAMLSLETIGYYSDSPNSQKYPFPFSIFYPSTGDFLGFVSNTRSKDLEGPPPLRHHLIQKKLLLPLTGRRHPGIHPRHKLVRPRLILAIQLPRHNGHGHRPISLSLLPLTR
jgi:Zn-dependent M28 family amino/carboxypeptidase